MSWLSDELVFEHSWYSNLLESGNEKLLISQFIKEKFLKTNIKSFLEVGMGTKPIFASILSSSVSEYVIVEKEDRDNIQLPVNTQLITSDFEEVKLNTKFDLVLLSHVVYYFEDLEKSLQKAIGLLNENGKAIFVVNGDQNDYGPLKQAFAEITNTSCSFTYLKLKECLEDYNFEEYTLASSVKFESFEELYENLRLFFDLYPNEFNRHKREIIDWLKKNIKDNSLDMDQKFIVVQK
ncbi:MAG: hypothetical protein S4CHLAM20_14290 [Chlamydiia bacterium]|nr:hypothetical protein [Chlamydiia bacterium]